MDLEAAKESLEVLLIQLLQAQEIMDIRLLLVKKDLIVRCTQNLALRL